MSCAFSATQDGRCPACDLKPAPADIKTRPGPGRPPVVRDDTVCRTLRRPHRLLTPVETT